MIAQKEQASWYPCLFPLIKKRGNACRRLLKRQPSLRRVATLSPPGWYPGRAAAVPPQRVGGGWDLYVTAPTWCLFLRVFWPCLFLLLVVFPLTLVLSVLSCTCATCWASLRAVFELLVSLWYSR